jgi:hypothetical protein
MNPTYTASAPNPYLQAGPPIHTSPGLAFVLGFIPGVGAIYNAQYLKGLVHAIIFGLLISMLDSIHNEAGAPFLGIILMVFVFYMPFEAYHTAKKRVAGIPVEEFSSLMGPNNRIATRTPIGPIFLILIGVLFLLNTLGWLYFRDLARFWPVLLILAGAFMLYNRLREPGGLTGRGAVPPPMANEYGETRQ